MPCRSTAGCHFQRGSCTVEEAGETRQPLFSMSMMVLQVLRETHFLKAHKLASDHEHFQAFRP